MNELFAAMFGGGMGGGMRGGGFGAGGGMPGDFSSMHGPRLACVDLTLRACFCGQASVSAAALAAATAATEAGTTGIRTDVSARFCVTTYLSHVAPFVLPSALFGSGRVRALRWRWWRCFRPHVEKASILHDIFWLGFTCCTPEPHHQRTNDGDYTVNCRENYQNTEH